MLLTVYKMVVVLVVLVALRYVLIRVDVPPPARLTVLTLAFVAGLAWVYFSGRPHTP